jgi:hypothetical protein
VSEPTEAEKNAGYSRCIDKLIEAGRAWQLANPFAEIRFNTREMIERYAANAGQGHLPWDKVAIIASLSDVIDEWAATEDAKRFLRHLDEATGGDATFLQVKAILDHAVEKVIERSTGKLPEDGDWRCAHCAHLIDGITTVDGSAPVPQAGAVTACAHCGEFVRIASDLKRYEKLPSRAFNMMPKSVRKMLLEVQRQIRKRVAYDKSKS